MRPWIAHYMNKYPGCQIDAGEEHLAVKSPSGQLILRLEKNGAKMWNDVSEEYGAPMRHCLAPIPKESRLWKITREGKIAKDELHDERLAISQEIASACGGFIPSIVEIVRQFENPKLDDRSWSDHAWKWVGSRAREKAQAVAIENKRAAQALEHNPPISTTGREVEPNVSEQKSESSASPA